MGDTMRELALQVGTLRLSEADDLARRFPAAFGRVRIDADTVEVRGWIQLFGRELEIRARRIVARPVNGRPAVLDVSGPPADPDFDPEAISPQLAGTPAAPAGKAGRAGGAGRDGGRLRVVVDSVDGELGLAANGSRGGAGERGGDGAQPPAPNGADGAFFKVKWPAKGPHGGGILEHAGLFNLYVSWAAGQAGGDARAGGAAGASGQPGNGGRGGAVELLHSGSQRPVLATTARGGAPGSPAAAARPGKASPAGHGGRNRMYVYGVVAGTHEAFARAGADKTVDEYARKHKIAARAPDGHANAGPGPVPPAPAADAGAAGSVRVAPLPLEQAARAYELSLLQLVLALAERDAAALEWETAGARLEWLIRLARVRAAADDVAAAALLERAERALHELPAPRAFARGARRRR
jgi:hypothetical protein